MTAPTPYQALRAEREAGRTEKPPRVGRIKLDPAVAKQRAAERTRRHMEARRRASLILSQRHPAEFLALLDAERIGVDAERGPLPGDPS